MKEKITNTWKRGLYTSLKQSVWKAIDAFTLGEKIIFGALLFIFALSAFSIVHKIDAKFMEQIPKRGGSLTEGLVGSPRYINPLLAFSDTDRDLVSLVYSGLLKAKPDGTLVPDLAETYSISDDGKEYTFTIRKDAVFHDGTPVTADDVIFTIQKALDPALKSPKRANWSGVTAEKVSDKVVKFTLKQAYAPFIENATLGILPKNIWKGASAEEFAFSQFNIEPIGSGPYKVVTVGRNSSGIPENITLQAFDRYALGYPYIHTLSFNFYSNEKDATDAYSKGKVEALHSISGDTAQSLQENGARIEQYPLPQIFAVFFNQNVNPIFAHKEIRQAFDSITDRNALIKEILKGFGTEAKGPIPNGLMQLESLDLATSNPTSIADAQKTLEKAGWKKNTDGIYELSVKKGKTETLAFSIATGDSPDLKKAAEMIKQQWEPLGAKIDIKVFEMNDLNQTIIRPRKYDALLFGEVVGREMDLYAFWHSSQRNDPGLNIAMYTNTKTDKLLEDARTTTDDESRLNKYQAFEKELLGDVPAVFTYSPDFIYVLPASVRGFSIGKIVNPSDRFADVEHWYTETDTVWKLFVPKELQN